MLMTDYFNDVEGSDGDLLDQSADEDSGDQGPDREGPASEADVAAEGDTKSESSGSSGDDQKLDMDDGADRVLEEAVVEHKASAVATFVVNDYRSRVGRSKRLPARFARTVLT